MSSDLTFVEGRATRDSMGPDKPHLTVTTWWEAPTPGWRLWLVLAGDVSIPGELVLRLVALRPWWPVPEVITHPRAVYFDAAADGIKKVTIEGVGNIRIIEVTDVDIAAVSGAAQVLSLGGAERPNHFELSGQGITVVYDTADVLGRPSLNLQRNGTTDNFGADDIHIEETLTGTMLSVITETAPDWFVRTLSVLLPAVNLPSSGAAQVSTVALEAEHRTSFDGGQSLTGQLTSVKPIVLEGMARVAQT